MILHLMVPFRTHLKLYDEEVIYNPEQYNTFWSEAKSNFQNNNFGFEKIIWSHVLNQNKKNRSRFRTVDHNSLLRPLELLKFIFQENDAEIKEVFNRSKNKLQNDGILSNVELVPESVVLRLFNNCVGILELDVKLNDFFNNNNNIETSLSYLQEFGVSLGENLAQLIYKTKIEYFLKELLTIPNSSQFIVYSLFNYEIAKSNKILVPESTNENYEIVVNWVTRSLLFEQEDKECSPEIIKHWLKDSGAPELIKSVLEHPNECAYRWLNYLFRESSYKRAKIEEKTENIDYTVPFCDEWEAMLISQYYYCAFEILNDSLDTTLSAAFLNYRVKKLKNRLNLKKINRKLEREIIDAHEILIEYQNNFAYYKRSVASYIKEIMDGWDFNNSILNQVKNKIELCEQRMGVLHQKTSERSALYTDLLLLSIAVISVIAFMFQVIEFGRNISHNADLAVYESNSFNLVKVLSERPTDFAISIGLGLMMIIFIVYYIFRRGKVLD